MKNTQHFYFLDGVAGDCPYKWMHDMQIFVLGVVILCNLSVVSFAIIIFSKELSWIFVTPY